MKDIRLETPYATQLKEENEQATNKTVALFLLLFIVMVPVGLVIVQIDYSDNIYFITTQVMLPISIALTVLEFMAYRNQYKSSWVKYMLMLGLALACNVHVFVYGAFVFYLIFIPVFVATRYFDKKFIVFTAVVCFLMSFTSFILNVVLSESEAIKTLHKWEMYDIWEYKIDAIMYIAVPLVFVGAFVAVYALSITERGKELLKKQIFDSNRIASVNAELEMGAEIQLNALPKAQYTTKNGNFQICAVERMAKEVGGDFYDYFMTDENTLIIVIADVSDKGVPAAMFMMSAKKTIRCLMKSTKNLKEAGNLINQFLCDDNKLGMFITMWIAAIDINSGKGKYINAAHTQPYIKHADGSLELIENDPNVFMGVFPDATYETNLIDLKAGDSLVMYTDGVTDAMNSESEPFGIERLRNVLGDADNSAKSICRNVIGKIDAFSAEMEQFDDITMMVLHCNELEETTKLQFELTRDSKTLESTIDKIDILLSDCPSINRRNAGTVIDEVYSNVFDYAVNGLDDVLNLEVKKGGNYADLIFSYIAEKFDPVQQEDPDTDEINYGGLGIYLIKNLSDRVEYEYKDNLNVINCRIIWNV